MAGTFTKKLLSFQFEYENGTNVTHSGLRASIKIVQPAGESYGSLEAAIFGMTLSDMNKLSTVGTQFALQQKNKITVSAGDENGMSVVFKGTIAWAFVDGQSQPNVCFRVTGVGGLMEAITPLPSTSIKGSADLATGILQPLCKQMGLTYEANGVIRKLLNPYLWGSGREQALRACKAAGVVMAIEKDVLITTEPGKPREGDPTIVSDQTGMIGYPSFVSNNIIVRQIYLPTQKVLGAITVQSELTPACGNWKVNKIDFDLETMVFNGKWQATMECIPGDVQPAPPP